MEESSQRTHRGDSKDEAQANDGRRGRFGNAERLSQLVKGAWGIGAAGASDCLRECGQPDDRAGDGAGAGDGGAYFDRRRQLEAGADGAGGELDHSVSCGDYWWSTRLAVGADGCQDD